MYLEVELLGNMVIVFRKKISRDHQIAFCRGRTILDSHQQCIRIPVSLYPCQYLLFSGFLLKFIVTLLMCVRWYLIILICISLIISIGKDIEKLESLCIVDGNPKWCGLYRKQSGGTSKFFS